MPAGHPSPSLPARHAPHRPPDSDDPSVHDDERLRFHARHAHVLAPFGEDAFGRRAEAFARLFGTPTFLIAQTAIVAVIHDRVVAPTSLDRRPPR